MTDKLKPCPFCGSEEVAEKWADGGAAINWIVCTECGAKGPWAKVGHDGSGARNWNTRTPVKIKPLQWEDFPKDDGPVISKAITLTGTYFIMDDTDDFSGWYLQLISHDRAQWWQHVRSICDHIDVPGYQMDDMEPLKTAAQTDYERRIREALEE